MATPIPSPRIMSLQTIPEQLAAYSTCDISDALLELKHPLGGFVSGITMWSPERQAGPVRIVGPAYTVKYAWKTETTAPILEKPYIDTIPPGSVVFISMPQGVEHAAYGGLMTRRARIQGGVGTVVDGNIRDLEEHRMLNFPVFARQVAAVPYFEVSRPSEINVPLYLQDAKTKVDPGDMIVADLNGVICIPKGLVSRTIKLLPSLVESAAKAAADIDRGVTFAEAKKRHRG